ncbi:hypothetical protein [Dyella telluris]|uniref:Uncharacterized protein n=1 Tax=Dyella telluris TaxID=2763498 RepID=A0A7G8Q4G1_9GAMM|nr:hypothetical protein [Dyella telluris]QNK01669.1 hypothetical protein H8F01_00365 [Dyella telluris]
MTLDGALETHFHRSPSLLGYRAFQNVLPSVLTSARIMAESSLMHFGSQMVEFLSAAKGDDALAGQATRQPLAESVPLVGNSIQHHFGQVAQIYQRKFRYMVASRQGTAVPLSTDLRTLNRAGQSMTSQNFVYLTMRKAALDLFNEVQMNLLRLDGHETAQIVTLSADSENNGRQIALVDGLELPTYLDLADEVFHPRSTAVVGAV